MAKPYSPSGRELHLPFELVPHFKATAASASSLSGHLSAHSAVIFLTTFFLHLTPWINVSPSNSPQLQFFDDRFFNLSLLPYICLTLANKMIPLLSAEAPSESTKLVYLVHFKSTACFLCSNSKVTSCTERYMELTHFPTGGYLFWSRSTVGTIWGGTYLIPVSRPWSGRKILWSPP